MGICVVAGLLACESVMDLHRDELPPRDGSVDGSDVDVAGDDASDNGPDQDAPVDINPDTDAGDLPDVPVDVPPGDTTGPECGNAVVEEGEECDLNPAACVSGECGGLLDCTEDCTLDTTCQTAGSINNDDCMTAYLLDPIPMEVLVNSTCGLMSHFSYLVSVSYEGPDAAFQFLLESATSIEVNTCINTAFDTVLFLMDGDCPGTEIAYNDDDDDCGEGGSRISMGLEPGLYTVILGGKGTVNQGLYTLTIREGTPE